MKALSLGQFLEKLPEIVSDVKNVVVATYNNIYSYANGAVIPNAKGKRITILCGGAARTNVEFDLGLNVPNQDVQATKTVGAKIVSDGLAAVAAETLVVLYAGKSRCDEMARLAYRITERGAKVALVSCGCYTDVFGRISPNENIILVMPLHGVCNGGRGDLSEIVDALLN